jgi:hypothetical protein
VLPDDAADLEASVDAQSLKAGTPISSLPELSGASLRTPPVYLQTLN